MTSVEPGTLLDGRYRIVAARASGATATVWAAEDEFLRRRVAVKILHPHLVDDADLLARFRDEARTAATVSHANLVAVYDSIQDHPGIVLEWIDGPDLRQRLDDGTLTPTQIAAIGVDLCAGLGALHAHGLVHRDVKPANILLGPGGETKLTDFGIATANAGDRTATGVVLGTAKYLAPEQVQGGVLDQRTDVFGLAAVLYEALAGRAPWVRDGDLPTAIARLEEDPPDLARLRPDVAGELSGAIMRGLARDPAERWPTTAAFSSGLLGGSSLAPPPPPPSSADMTRADRTETIRLDEPPPRARSAAAPTGPSPRPRRPRRKRWPRLVGAAITIASAALGWTLVAGGDGDDEGEDGVPTDGGTVGDLEIISADAFDPEGTGPPGEHDDRAPDAIDGDLATSWPTERYDSRTFGTKSGVGLVLRLARSSTIEAITVETLDSDDWSAEIRVIDAAAVADAASVDDFGPIDARATGLATVATVPVGASGDTIVLWITDLGEGDLPRRLNVAEVTIR
ncbi:MAG: serine/threonine-protein kinase [Actinomycetota bacterium]